MNFTLTQTRIDALRRTISEPRLGPYMADSGDDFEAALHLYERNARISEAFYRPLQGLEVCVRNALNYEFSQKWGEDWHDQTAIRLQNQQSQDVRRAISDLEADGKEAKNGAVVAELKFGFWVGVLGPKSEIEIWRKAGYRAFPHRPRGTERKLVQGALNKIRRLRNRVFHHERITHRNLVDDYKTIIKITEWVCPETAAWIDAYSEIDLDELAK